MEVRMPPKKQKPAREHATERTKIEIVETWDGGDVRTHEAAKLEIELPFFRSYSYGTPPSREAKAEILRLLEREIQPVADQRFGKGSVRVKVTKVTAGSLTIFFTLVTIG